jgi:hypothetical protein
MSSALCHHQPFYIKHQVCNTPAKFHQPSLKHLSIYTPPYLSSLKSCDLLRRCSPRSNHRQLPPLKRTIPRHSLRTHNSRSRINSSISFTRCTSPLPTSVNRLFRLLSPGRRIRSRGFRNVRHVVDGELACSSLKIVQICAFLRSPKLRAAAREEAIPVCAIALTTHHSSHTISTTRPRQTLRLMALPSTVPRSATWSRGRRRNGDLRWKFWFSIFVDVAEISAGGNRGHSEGEIHASAHLGNRFAAVARVGGAVAAAEDGRLVV